jgi:N-acetylneuraminic acid mutarotase
LTVSVAAMTMVAMAFSFVAPSVSASWGYTWAYEPDMGAPTSQAVVVTGADGLVYVLGGVADATYIATTDAYSYDPDSGDWTELAPLDFAVRGAAGAVGLDGLIYVISGWTSGPVIHNQIYDPATDTWSAGAPIPVPVWEAKAATVANGSICVVGGEGLPAGYMQIYDPVADSWSSGPSTPAPVLIGAMVAVGDDLYYTGGANGYSPATNLFKYDAALGDWVTLADMPEARVAHAMVVGVDGMLYVVGGGITGSNDADGVATADVYDPLSDEWSSAPDMAVARTYLGAAVTEDGRILALGGSDGGAVSDVVESLQLYLFDCQVELSSSSVRAGESVQMTVDPQFELAEEWDSEFFWYLVSDADETLYSEDFVWNPTAGPRSVTVDVPLVAVPGEYTIVIDYLSVWGDTVFEHLEMLEVPLTVLPAATPVEDLIADLESQIADLESQITDLESQMTVLESSLADLGVAMDTADAELMAEITALLSQVSDLEDALAALETSMSSDNQDLADEIAALQDEIALLQDSIAGLENSTDEVQSSVDSKMDSALGFAVIGLLVVILVLLALMMVMGRKGAVPPPPMS